MVAISLHHGHPNLNMVDHGHVEFMMVDHGLTDLTMVLTNFIADNHGRPWSLAIFSMIDHGRLHLNMVNRGQPCCLVARLILASE